MLRYNIRINIISQSSNSNKYVAKIKYIVINFLQWFIVVRTFYIKRTIRRINVKIRFIILIKSIINDIIII